MAIPTQAMTVEQFDKWTILSENMEKTFEYIGGEIYEVPSNPYSSAIASEINYRIKHYLRSRKMKGHVTGESGGFMVSGERYAPDVAYISYQKQKSLPYTEGYNPNPPDLAVEVVSPNDSERKLTTKVVNYLAAGTIVWIVRPEEKVVEIFITGQSVKTLSENDTIDGHPILPDFKLKVSEIFPEK